MTTSIRALNVELRHEQTIERSPCRYFVAKSWFAGLVVAAVVTVIGGCDSGGGASEAAPNLATCMDRAIFGASENSNYLLPFPVGDSSEVLQAYCSSGQKSHNNQMAYDFIRPFGSEVTAVRNGEIKRVESHHPDYTEDNVHNHILVTHEDGTTAFYAHLQQDMIFVIEGEFVNAGQLLGLNGSSGTPTACDPWIVTPTRDQCAILHFGVYATYPPVEGDDLAVNFRNSDDALDSRDGLREWTTYTALDY